MTDEPSGAAESRASAPLDQFVSDLHKAVYGESGHQWGGESLDAVRTILMKVCAFGAEAAHRRAESPSPVEPTKQEQLNGIEAAYQRGREYLVRRGNGDMLGPVGVIGLLTAALSDALDAIRKKPVEPLSAACGDERSHE